MTTIDFEIFGVLICERAFNGAKVLFYFRFVTVVAAAVEPLNPNFECEYTNVLVKVLLITVV